MVSILRATSVAFIGLALMPVLTLATPNASTQRTVADPLPKKQVKEIPESLLLRSRS